ncbi:DedA family protein, partial [Shigella flexneri]
PPASIMMATVITVSKTTLSPWEAGITVMSGAWCGTIVNYHLGIIIGHIPQLACIISSRSNTIERVRLQLQNNSVSILFTSRFIAVLRYIAPLVAGMLQ